MTKAIEELQLLHDAPKRSYTEKEREEPNIWYPWKGRQDAYSCLISVANAENKLKPLPEHVVNQVIVVLNNYILNLKVGLYIHNCFCIGNES